MNGIGKKESFKFKIMKFLAITILVFCLSILYSCASVKTNNSIFWVNGYKTKLHQEPEK